MIFVKFRHFSLIQRYNIISFSNSSSLLNLKSSMKILIEKQKYEEALALFDQNLKSVSKIEITLALKACTKLKDLKRGKTIHQYLTSQSINDSFLNTSLIHLYMSCGDEDNAYRVFNGIKNKISGEYNAMFKGFITNKKPEKVLNLFEQMLIEPDNISLNILFNACAKLPNERALKIKNKFLDQIPKLISTNIYVLNSFLHMLMKFGDISNAEELFNQIKTKTIATYGTMIQGYLDNQMFERALDIYEQMPFSPDEIISIILFKVCSEFVNERSLKLGRKMFKQILKTFYNNPALLTSCLNMLMKFGDVTDAEKLFNQIKTKTTATYGAMIQGYSDNQMFEKALDTYEQMPFSPDEIILIILFKVCSKFVNERSLKLGRQMFKKIPKTFYNNPALLTSCLNMLIKFGDVTDAENVFNQIQNKHVSYYGAMMNGYNLNNQPDKCLKVFNQMQQDAIEPDEVIFKLALGACSQIGLFSLCQSIVDQIPSHLLNDQRLQNALIDTWGKVALVDNAWKIFKQVKKPDKVTYTAMINSFGLNGMGHEAVDLFRGMPVEFRDEINYLCVINACSHSGLIHQAHSIFNEIQVDCMSRMFMFDGAQKLINQYELSHPPYIVMYMALLSGARNHRNFSLSQKLLDRMKHLFPDEKQYLISGSVLLSNTLVSIGEDDQAKQVRDDQIQQIGKRNIVGISWTQANGQLAMFKAHDQSHLQTKEIYEEVARISSELIQNGHVYDSSWITGKINDGETIESILSSHSEKLALAFNFIQQPIPDIIQITKNLRVCGDCHAATKLIAKIRQRPIIIRDANRIHHFGINGQCSCQDHF